MGVPRPLYWGTLHAGTGVPSPLSPPVVGNPRVVACNICLTCCGVSAGRTESISAAVPDTRGAAKLVPSENLKLSV